MHGLVNFMSVAAVVLASFLIGSEFGVKVGVSVGLIGWALITPIKQSVR